MTSISFQKAIYRVRNIHTGRLAIAVHQPDGGMPHGYVLGWAQTHPKPGKITPRRLDYPLNRAIWK